VCCRRDTAHVDPNIISKSDLSILPSNASRWLSAPTATTPGFIAAALVFSTIFFILFTMIAFRAKLGAKLSAQLDRPMVQRASAWIGLFGFMIGMSSKYLSWRTRAHLNSCRTLIVPDHSLVVRKSRR